MVDLSPPPVPWAGIVSGTWRNTSRAGQGGRVKRGAALLLMQSCILPHLGGGQKNNFWLFSSPASLGQQNLVLFMLLGSLELPFSRQ